MCGIAGFLNKEISSDQIHKEITSMISGINHRGPDKNGYWIDSKYNLVLANTRLAIQDLSENGNQPMKSKSGRYLIVFNGEIYNFKKLKLEYLSNIKSIGNSDTEVFLDLIDKFGLMESLKFVEGMFAFALWDNFEQKLTLGRDRIGEKPLYFGYSSNKFVFSSELKGIKKLSFFENSVDVESINLYLKYSFIPAPKSIYKDIFKLEPGKLAIFNPKTNSFYQKRYWDGTKNYKEKKENENLDYTNQLEKILTEEISNQLISDAPIGTFLSGGIDSTLVTAIAQSVSDKKINTFTIGFEDKNFNEAHEAKNISKILGTNHHEHYINNREIISSLEDMSKVYDEPFSDSSQIPTFLVSKNASKKVKVILSGDGGDEMFGGYNRHILTNNYYSKLNLLPKFIRHAAKSVISKDYLKIYLIKLINIIKINNKINFNQKILDKLNNVINSKNFLDYYDKLITVSDNYHKYFKKSSFFDSQAVLNKSYQNLTSVINKKISYTEKMILLDIIFCLPSDILCKVDRASMANSLEVRCPFLGKNIVDVALKLPTQEKLNKNEGKLILKKILSKYISPKVFDRPKSGFGVPLEIWIRGIMSKKIEEVLYNSDYDNLGLDKVNIQNLWKNFKNHKNNRYDEIWNIVSILQWSNNLKINEN